MEAAYEAIDSVGAIPYASRLTSLDRRGHLGCG
jgi:hypothetical protein